MRAAHVAERVRTTLSGRNLSIIPTKTILSIKTFTLSIIAHTPLLPYRLRPFAYDAWFEHIVLVPSLGFIQQNNF